MTAFRTASLVEARGLSVLLPWLDERSYQGRVVRTVKGPLARYMQDQIGDVLMNTDPATLWSVELKIEERHTGNLFLETWSNRNLDDRTAHADLGSNPGWMFKLRADVVVYYFLDTDDLYTIPFFRLKRWAFGWGETPGKFYTYKEVVQRKYCQPNDTCGRLVPVSVLMREVGMKHTTVRQISMPFGEPN